MRACAEVCSSHPWRNAAMMWCIFVIRIYESCKIVLDVITCFLLVLRRRVIFGGVFVGEGKRRTRRKIRCSVRIYKIFFERTRCKVAMFTSSVKSYPKCSVGTSGQLLCAVQQMGRCKEPLQVCAQRNVQAVRCLSQRNIGELPDARRRVLCVPCMPLQYNAVIVNQQDLCCFVMCLFLMGCPIFRRVRTICDKRLLDPSVYPSTWNNSALTGRICMKLDIWGFFTKNMETFQV